MYQVTVRRAVILVLLVQEDVEGRVLHKNALKALISEDFMVLLVDKLIGAHLIEPKALTSLKTVGVGSFN